MTIDELMKIINRDRAYWGSKGGVTITGGEPLMQHEFVFELLKRCYKSYINTLIETSAYAPWKHLEKMIPYLDWIFVDIKHMDPVKHKEGTGVSNELILENIRNLANVEGPRTVIRMPVIPGYNDGFQNVEAMAIFMRKIGLYEVNLLPFHRLGTSKYEQLGKEYLYKDVKPPSREKLASIKEVFSDYGIKCYVGDDTPF